MKYGRSCVRCKSYFVTDEEGAHLCPWCVNAEAGPSVAESYEFPEP